MPVSPWRARIEKRKRLKRRKDNLRPLSRDGYISGSAPGSRKLHMAIVGGTETFCGLIGGRVGSSDDFINYKSGRGYTVAKDFRQTTCAKCIRVCNELVNDIHDLKRKRALNANGQRQAVTSETK